MTYFNTGTDEHGIKIFEKAKEKGLDAQAFVDQGFLTFKESLKRFLELAKIFILFCTTDEHHIKSARILEPSL